MKNKRDNSPRDFKIIKKIFTFITFLVSLGLIVAAVILSMNKKNESNAISPSSQNTVLKIEEEL